MLETYPKDSFDDRATVNTSYVWQMEGGLRFDILKDRPARRISARRVRPVCQASATPLTRWRALVTQHDYGRMLYFRQPEWRFTGLRRWRHHLRLWLL